MKLINKLSDEDTITLVDGRKVPRYNLDNSISLGLGSYLKNGHVYVNTDVSDETSPGIKLYIARDRDGNPIRDLNGKLITGDSLESALKKAVQIYSALNGLTNINTDDLDNYIYSDSNRFPLFPITKSNSKDKSSKEIFIPKSLYKNHVENDSLNPIARFKKYFTTMSYGPEGNLNEDVIKITEKNS